MTSIEIAQSAGPQGATGPEAEVTRAKVEAAQQKKPAESTTTNTFLGTKAQEVIAAKGEGNVALGSGALEAVTTGKFNTAVGATTLKLVTVGAENTAFGARAGTHLGGSSNTAIGAGALELSEEGATNVAVGISALKTSNAPGGIENVAIGSAAMERLTTGKKNVGVGTNALGECKTGESNVAIGTNAGLGELGSKKLYIANTSTETPLIFGEFPNAKLQFNATEMGFFSHAVTTKFGKIAEPAETLAGHQAAIKELREALFKIGITTE